MSNGQREGQFSKLMDFINSLNDPEYLAEFNENPGAYVEEWHLSPEHQEAVRGGGLHTLRRLLQEEAQNNPGGDAGLVAYAIKMKP
jgi:hypothetical protein